MSLSAVYTVQEESGLQEPKKPESETCANKIHQLFSTITIKTSECKDLCRQHCLWRQWCRDFCTASVPDSLLYCAIFYFCVQKTKYLSFVYKRPNILVCWVKPLEKILFRGIRLKSGEQWQMMPWSIRIRIPWNREHWFRPFWPRFSQREIHRLMTRIWI